MCRVVVIPSGSHVGQPAIVCCLMELCYCAVPIQWLDCFGVSKLHVPRTTEQSMYVTANREEAQVLFARLLSGYGRDASLNATERRAPGTVSITQLPGSPSACRGNSHFGSEAMDGEWPLTLYP